MEIRGTIKDFKAQGWFSHSTCYLANEGHRWILDNDSGLL